MFEEVFGPLGLHFASLLAGLAWAAAAAAAALAIRQRRKKQQLVPARVPVKRR